MPLSTRRRLEILLSRTGVILALGVGLSLTVEVAPQSALQMFAEPAKVTLSGPRSAEAGVPRRFSEAQALTRAAPTLATEGMPLDSVVGFRVTICAAAGQTLTGGTVRSWIYNGTSGLWSLNPDLDALVTNVGTRCRTFPDARVSARQPNDRFLPATSSVTTSAGTVTIYVDGWTE